MANVAVAINNLKFKEKKQEKVMVTAYNYVNLHIYWKKETVNDKLNCGVYIALGLICSSFNMFWRKWIFGGKPNKFGSFAINNLFSLECTT